MIDFVDLQGATSQQLIRSRYPPSSRAGLFTVSEHSTYRRRKAEDILTVS